MWNYCSKQDVADYSGLSQSKLKDAWSDIVESMIQEHVGTDYGGTTTYTEAYDGDGTDTLILNNTPVSSVASLSIGDTALSSSLYEVYNAGYIRLVSSTGSDLDEAMGTVQSVFPKGTQNIDVVYVAGNASVPGYVRLAAILMVTELALVSERAGADGSLSISRSTQRAGFGDIRPRSTDVSGALRTIMQNTIGDRWRFA